MNKLSNKELNAMLQNAFAGAAPDKADAIIGAARKDNRAPIYGITQTNTASVYRKSAALIAAGLVLVVGLIVLLTTIRSNTPYAVITVESDECIEITLNRDYRPLSFSGRNTASIRLARQIERCDQVETAIDGALDAMLENGNLSENNNTILITVDSPENGKELLKQSLAAARESFTDSDFNGAILTAVASDDKEVARISRRNRISVGKSEMVRDIVRKDRSQRTEYLCRLSVNELNLLSYSRSVIYDNIGVYGESRGCIPPQNAIDFVAGDFGDGNASVTATLSADQYGLVYSVTVRGKDGVYIYRVNAENGEILTVSQGDTLQAALTADQNNPTPAPSEKETAPTENTPSEPTRPTQNSRILTETAPTTAVSPTEAANNVTKPEPTEAKQQKLTTAKQQKPTTKPQPAVQKPTTKPQPATQKPTQAEKPTSAPATSPPTQAQEPAAFSSPDYYPSGGVQSGSPLTSSARRISVRRVVNGYNTYYDADSFPYAARGKQGGVSALVCNREQFVRLTGSTDSRFDDAYFKTHVLYVHMNRDAAYHWVKSIDAAYMDGGTLCIRNSEPVGYYITPESSKADQIYTVIYELNKSDLSDFVNMVEYTE